MNLTPFPWRRALPITVLAAIGLLGTASSASAASPTPESTLKVRVPSSTTASNARLLRDLNSIPEYHPTSHAPKTMDISGDSVAVTLPATADDPVRLVSGKLALGFRLPLPHGAPRKMLPSTELSFAGTNYRVLTEQIDKGARSLVVAEAAGPTSLKPAAKTRRRSMKCWPSRARWWTGSPVASIFEFGHGAPINTG